MSGSFVLVPHMSMSLVDTRSLVTCGADSIEFVGAGPAWRHAEEQCAISPFPTVKARPASGTGAGGSHATFDFRG